MTRAEGRVAVALRIIVVPWQNLLSGVDHPLHVRVARSERGASPTFHEIVDVFNVRRWPCDADSFALTHQLWRRLGQVACCSARLPSRASRRDQMAFAQSRARPTSRFGVSLEPCRFEVASFSLHAHRAAQQAPVIRLRVLRAALAHGGAEIRCTLQLERGEPLEPGTKISCKD